MVDIMQPENTIFQYNYYLYIVILIIIMLSAFFLVFVYKFFLKKRNVKKFKIFIENAKTIEELSIIYMRYIQSKYTLSNQHNADEYFKICIEKEKNAQNNISTLQLIMYEGYKKDTTVSVDNVKSKIQHLMQI